MRARIKLGTLWMKNRFFDVMQLVSHDQKQSEQSKDIVIDVRAEG